MSDRRASGQSYEGSCSRGQRWPTYELPFGLLLGLWLRKLHLDENLHRVDQEFSGKLMLGRKCVGDAEVDLPELAVQIVVVLEEPEDDHPDSVVSVEKRFRTRAREHLRCVTQIRREPVVVVDKRIALVL